MSTGPICPKCGGDGGVIVPIPGDMPTTGPCKTCAPTADPSKVNALRKLTEAAEAIGWSAGATDGKVALYAPGIDQPVACIAFGLVVAIVPVDVDLMALLLEASR